MNLIHLDTFQTGNMLAAPARPAVLFTRPFAATPNMEPRKPPSQPSFLNVVLHGCDAGRLGIVLVKSGGTAFRFNFRLLRPVTQLPPLYRVPHFLWGTREPPSFCNTALFGDAPLEDEHLWDLQQAHCQATAVKICSVGIVCAPCCLVYPPGQHLLKCQTWRQDLGIDWRGPRGRRTKALLVALDRVSKETRHGQ